jgi:HD-like signal output (HDOD) protein
MKAAREFVGDMAEQISMPEVYVAIRQLLLNSDTTLEDFVEVLERDSMLSVRVMRMAKSQYFGFPRDCENLYQAISLIGLMQLHDLILCSLCMRTFAAIPEQVFNLKAFWRYCVQCGIAARTIGKHSNTASHHVFFTLGLLHEIGHAALFLKAPEKSLQALELSQLYNRDIAEVEREQLGFDYCQAGSELMHGWHLPPVYQQVAAFHLEPERAEEEFQPAVDVIHLAHALCQDSSQGKHQHLIANCIEQKPLFKNLPPNIDEIVIEEIEANTDTVLGLLWPRCAQDLSFQQAGVSHA